MLLIWKMLFWCCCDDDDGDVVGVAAVVSSSTLLILVTIRGGLSALGERSAAHESCIVKDERDMLWSAGRSSSSMTGSPSSSSSFLHFKGQKLVIDAMRVAGRGGRSGTERGS